MPIKDLKDEFIAAGNGELHLSSIGGGCLMPYVVGPDGKGAWQQLIFWGGHGPSNKQFVVNPIDVNHPIMKNRVVIRTGPTPPMGDLMEAARKAARAVLAALAPTSST